jgi:hypothetical protein
MGTFRTETRLALDKADLINLMTFNTLSDVADMYNCSIYMVQVALTNQLSKREIGFKADEPSKVDLSEGAWMGSDERKVYQRLMNNNYDFKEINKI